MITRFNTEVAAVASPLLCMQGFHSSLQPRFPLPGTVLGAGDRTEDRTSSPCLPFGGHVLGEETDKTEGWGL